MGLIRVMRRAAAGTGLVFAGFLVLTELLARAAWLMPQAGRVPENALPAEDGALWKPAIGTAVHRVEEWPADRPRQFNEAPQLAALVEAGQLPPVEDRLPADPLVVVPTEQCGPYGGTWRRLATSPVDVGNSFARLFNEGLLRYSATGDRILPNLAASWTVEDEGRTYTFRLRRGVRWSDGAPLTTDDVLFWYEDILQNPDLTPVIPTYYKRDGRLMRLERVDDYTFRVHFEKPYGLFLPMVAGRLAGDFVRAPKHYLQQYHPRYVEEAKLEELAREERVDLWHRLFVRKREWYNPDLPVITAWVLKRPPPARPLLWERNPYYWKVDPEGNQLPYIDRMTAEIFDAETINLKAIHGEVGFQGRNLAFSNYPLFMENRERGKYRVLHWVDGGDMMTCVMLNLNHKDPVLRDVFRDVRVRKALSLAIDRDELCKIAYFGLGKGRQMAPPSLSPFHDAAYAQAYTQFDPDEANRLLDAAGLDRRDDRGVRLMPDGRPFHLTIEMASALLYPLLIQLVAEHWTEVGVETEMRILARELVNRRMEASLFDVTVWTGAGEYQPLLDPRYFFPHNLGSYWGLDFWRWYETGGRRGEKPLPPMLRCIDIFRRIEATPDEAEQVRLFKEILEINRQELWTIGLVGELPALYVVPESFRNVPEMAVASFTFTSPGNVAVESFAIEQEE